MEVFEGSIAGKHLVIACTLTVTNQEIPTHGQIEWRANGIAFMNEAFACHYQIPAEGLNDTYHVEVLVGRAIQPGNIPHIAKVGMMIDDHGE